MGRRTFSREFKLEAVRLVKERGVAVAQAARDLDLHPNVLRNWLKDLEVDPSQAFPGQGRMGMALYMWRLLRYDSVDQESLGPLSRWF